MKTIRLINGPYNGRVIEDIGTVVIKMGISTDGETIGATVGTALYEPSPDRAMAFWEGNTWDGLLLGVVR